MQNAMTPSQQPQDNQSCTSALTITWETGREWGAAGAHPGLRLGGQHHTLGRTSKRSVCVETWRSVSGMDQVSGEGSRCVCT